jgi:hypothetical protein
MDKIYRHSNLIEFRPKSRHCRTTGEDAKFGENSAAEE